MKKIIALLLALVMVLGLAACSVEQAPAPTEAPKSEGGCGGMIAGAVAVVALVAACGAVVLRKKED